MPFIARGFSAAADCCPRSSSRSSVLDWGIAVAQYPAQGPADHHPCGDDWRCRFFAAEPEPGTGQSRLRACRLILPAGLLESQCGLADLVSVRTRLYVDTFLCGGRAVTNRGEGATSSRIRDPRLTAGCVRLPWVAYPPECVHPTTVGHPAAPCATP